MEVIQGYIRHKKIVNRGFLLGPLCPIYGYGALAITLLLSKYAYDIKILFVMSMVICSILEYFTSYFMEKLFNTRWWDYSNRKFNINGRICLETLIPFGILGCIITYFINPVAFTFISKIPNSVLNVSTIILFTVYIIDNLISFTIISNLKHMKLKGDSTEEISKQVRKIINDRQVKMYNRVIKAFPTLKIVRKK